MAAWLPGRALKADDRHEAREQIAAAASPRVSFYVLVLLSTSLACYGLMLDNVTVIIGAMLVAPLTGPIFGVALGLVGANRRLTRASSIAELHGVLLALLVATLIGLLPWRLEFGEAVKAFTQPRFYDLLVAAVAGLAGAYAMVCRQVSPALPGVAIATAQLPPLAVCGMALASGDLNWAASAGILFLSNFVAIELAAGFVFLIFQLPERTLRDVKPLQVAARFLPSIVIAIVLVVVLGLSLLTTARRQGTEQRVRDTLTSALALRPAAALWTVDFGHEQGQLLVHATVVSAMELQATEVAALEQLLQAQTRRPVHLLLRTIIGPVYDRAGPVDAGPRVLGHRRRRPILLPQPASPPKD